MVACCEVSVLFIREISTKKLSIARPNYEEGTNLGVTTLTPEHFKRPLFLKEILGKTQRVQFCLTGLWWEPPWLEMHV